MCTESGRLGVPDSTARDRALLVPTCRHDAEPSAGRVSLRRPSVGTGDGADDAFKTVGRFTRMTRFPVLIMVGVLAAAPRASSACQWFGTQLECDLGASRVVIGTQAAEQPTYARSFPIRAFHAGGGA